MTQMHSAAAAVAAQAKVLSVEPRSRRVDRPDAAVEWRAIRGRPAQGADDILQRMRNITVTQAWTILYQLGSQWQYEGGFVNSQPGPVDCRRTDNIEADFSDWLDDHFDELPMPKDQIQQLLQHRTW